MGFRTVKRQRKISLGINQLFVGCVTLGILSRCLPHIPNFSPVIGLSIFASVYLPGVWRSLGVPLLISFVSDLILNNTIYASYFDGFTFFYSGWPYIAYTSCYFASRKILRTPSVGNVCISSPMGTVIFFIVSNFGVWFQGGYPQNIHGLMSCYIAGLPFFKNALLGDGLYTLVFFGTFAWFKRFGVQLSKS